MILYNTRLSGFVRAQDQVLAQWAPAAPGAAARARRRSLVAPARGLPRLHAAGPRRPALRRRHAVAARRAHGHGQPQLRCRWCRLGFRVYHASAHLSRWELPGPAKARRGSSAWCSSAGAHAALSKATVAAWRTHTVVTCSPLVMEQPSCWRRRRPSTRTEQPPRCSCPASTAVHVAPTAAAQDMLHMLGLWVGA